MPLCDMMWGADSFFFSIFCLGFFGIFEGPFPFRQEGVTGCDGSRQRPGHAARHHHFFSRILATSVYWTGARWYAPYPLGTVLYSLLLLNPSDSISDLISLAGLVLTPCPSHVIENSTRSIRSIILNKIGNNYYT